MASERKIKGFKSRQRSLLLSFKIIQDFVDSYDEETQSVEIPARLEHLTAMWTEYNSIQSELEMLDESTVDDNLKQRSDFQIAYYKVKGFLTAHNKSPESKESVIHQAMPLQSHSSNVRLPDVKLPVFNGNLESWLTFHDLFLSLVHSSKELSNIQKFYYLRSSLAGEALKLIQTIAISASNYPIAWNLLIEHFHDTSRLKQANVDALFEFPSLKRESADELHSLVERFEANVKILAQLGEKTEHWDILLVRMLSTCLDSHTRRDWEEHASSQKDIKFKDLTSFIHRRVTVLQTLKGKPIETPARKSSPRHASNFGAAANQRKCIICNDHHPVYQCPKFAHMRVEEKQHEVRRHNLCLNCLRKGHQAKNCPSISTCRRCNKHHHTQLCSDAVPASSSSKGNEIVATNLHRNNLSQSSNAATARRVEKLVINPSGVILATVVIHVVDRNGTKHIARALLDSGSECSFVSESFAQQLRAKRTKVDFPISGIGNTNTQARYKITTTVQSRTSAYFAIVELLVLPKLVIDLPSVRYDTETWNISPTIRLADPAFNMPHSIDILLGAELFFEVFSSQERISLGENLPTLINSQFGWVVTGKVQHTHTTSISVSNVAVPDTIDQQLQRFWELEEEGLFPCFSPEELACEEHFCRTVTRTPEGRYKVKLPLKEEIAAQLDNNHHASLRRFFMLESRLERNASLKQQYDAFLDEYLALGHMQCVTEPETSIGRCFHLPHHAVVREDKSTTKIRVVFDASCKGANGISLNDAMMVGPMLQEDLRSIIMRSRTNAIMLVADIQQMYRQVLVHETDTPLQRIFYRKHHSLPLETFQLNTVTYGTASAPYLATRVLLKLAEDEQQAHPKAARVLRTDFYVDDLLSGASSVSEAIELRIELENLLKKGGFTLRKWVSNNTEVLSGMPDNMLSLENLVDLNREHLACTGCQLLTTSCTKSSRKRWKKESI